MASAMIEETRCPCACIGATAKARCRSSGLPGVDQDGAVVDLLRRGYREASASAPQPALRTFVPIWMDPLMTVNAETFIHDALALAGGENVFADRVRRYPLQADLGRDAGGA